MVSGYYRSRVQRFRVCNPETVNSEPVNAYDI
jgi:hypothetical protein